MNKYINKPNNNNIMNKIIIFILMFFMTLSLVNGFNNNQTAIFETNGTLVIENLEDREISSTYGGTFFSADTLETNFFKIFSGDMFLRIRTYEDNTIFKLKHSGNIIEDILIKDIGEHYFQFKSVGNPFFNEIQFTDLTATYIEFEFIFVDTEKFDLADTTIFTPLIDGVVDLIEINISIWRIFYYLFIATIILSVITGIVILAYRFYVWADKVNIYERKRSNFKK